MLRRHKIGHLPLILIGELLHALINFFLQHTRLSEKFSNNISWI